jgi:uncharacterized membrane protein YeaQ/YmgE (transglycosylase-associated protein family)
MNMCPHYICKPREINTAYNEKTIRLLSFFLPTKGMEMDYRGIGKMVVRMVIGAVVKSLVEEKLEERFPGTERFHIAGIVGSVAGKIVSDKLESRTDKLVDDVADRIEQAKAEKKIDPKK